MVKQCYRCKKLHYLNPTLSYHRFPANAQRREEWLRRLGYDNTINMSKYALICSEHFQQEDISIKPSGIRALKPTALPLQFVPALTTVEQIYQALSTSSESTLGELPTIDTGSAQACSQLFIDADQESSGSEDNHQINSPPIIKTKAIDEPKPTTVYDVGGITGVEELNESIAANTKYERYAIPSQNLPDGSYVGKNNWSKHKNKNCGDPERELGDSITTKGPCFLQDDNVTRMEDSSLNGSYKIRTKDFDEICRCCLSSDVFLDSIFELTYEGTSLVDIFYNLFGTLLDIADDLPKKICESCFQEIIRFYNFKRQYKASEVALRNITVKTEDMNGDIEIKYEALTDSFDEYEGFQPNERNVMDYKEDEVCNETDEKFIQKVNNGKQEASQEETFTQKLELKHQLLRAKSFTSSEPTKQFVCDKCGKLFLNQPAFTFHLHKHSLDEEQVLLFAEKSVLSHTLNPYK